MQGHYATGHIVEVGIGKACVIHHTLQGLLIWVHANRFGKVLVAVGIASKQLAQLGQYIKLIAVVDFG